MTNGIKRGQIVKAFSCEAMGSLDAIIRKAGGDAGYVYYIQYFLDDPCEAFAEGPFRTESEAERELRGTAPSDTEVWKKEEE